MALAVMIFSENFKIQIIMKNCIKDKSSAEFDIVSLGEVMLRLDPGEDRIRTARNFRVWEGGGEYNVARGLKKCFGLRAGLVSAFAKNEVGYLIEDFIMQGGVNMDFVKWVKADGAGRKVRNGLNFTERGYGIRGALGCSDRGNSAASQLKPGDIDWESLFGDRGVRWFHTGGIFAALSETTGDVVLEAAKAAKKHGTIVSYDLNYRPSLWADIGGQARAVEINSEIAKYVDVMIGNEEDFTACLGMKVEGLDENISKIDVEAFKEMIKNAVKKYPNFKATATTLRKVKSATLNDWSAICWCGGNFYESKKRENLEIFDRVGGGDSFASGFIYGMMELGDPQLAVDYGAAHGALAMTTPGDTSTARLEEVKRLAETSAGARVIR